MNMPAAVLVSARRSAIGRVGGLHRNRRIEELAEPVLRAALADAGCEPGQIGGIILGNTTAGAKAARAIGLAAGLPETSYALTLDSQCASGLDAIIDAARRIAAGEAECLIAGGAESISTAPWRIGRPKNPYQMPHFIGYHAPGMEAGGGAEAFEADEVLARQLDISRGAQDAYVLHAQLAAEQARQRRQFIGEIVGQRDQCSPDLDLEELQDLQPYQSGDGTLTPGNTSALADGAAFAVLVSGKMWEALGRPKGLVLQRSHACGVTMANAASAGRYALDALLQKGATKASRDPGTLAAVETSEASAVEALALVRGLKLGDGVLNAGGGALVRGQPLGAASAVCVARLFSRLVRAEAPLGRLGAVTQRATGGLGLAALFEAIG
ncbi:MAG: beta-ketoacyl synthase N-terminal-like domain-containing protein [Hyphomicrobiaceae bacterium]